jgi:hypothetical protein
VAVIPGSAAGLTSAGDLLISRATPGVEGIIAANQYFGAALAAG